MTANQVYDAVSKAIDTLGLLVSCYSVAPTKVESLPVACIFESDNFTTSAGLSLKAEEKTRISQFTIEVYTDRKSGGLSQAKTIIEKANQTMTSKGYYRTMQSVIPNADTSVIRIIAKYRRIIGDTEV